MTSLDAVFRVDDPGTPDEQWSSYSFPVGIYVSGTTLDEVRSEFRAAATFALADFRDRTVIEHLERPMQIAPSTYLRVMLDRQVRAREEIARLMEESLSVPAQRSDFLATVPLSASGDAVMIACLPDDRLSWLFRQITDQDGVGLCSGGPSVSGGRFIWWSFVVGSEAVFIGAKPTETLAEAGLDEDSTISEFMRANASSTGRRLVGTSV